VLGCLGLIIYCSVVWGKNIFNELADIGRLFAATFISTMLVPVVYVLLETLRETVVNVEEEVRNRESL
jgi:hypothetical protein